MASSSKKSSRGLRLKIPPPRRDRYAELLQNHDGKQESQDEVEVGIIFNDQGSMLGIDANIVPPSERRPTRASTAGGRSWADLDGTFAPSVITEGTLPPSASQPPTPADFRGNRSRSYYEEPRQLDPREMNYMQQTRLQGYFDHGGKYDEVDMGGDYSFAAPPPTHRKGRPETPTAGMVPWYSLLITVGSMFTFFADIGSDIWVAVMYYRGGHYWWFGLTICFIAVPAVVMTLFSLKWYVTDHNYEKKAYPDGRSAFRWIPRFFFLFFQLAPILRYIDTIRYALKLRKPGKEEEKRHWYGLMLYEDTDATLLRLFETFLEAAPQLVLQVYIMTVLGASGGVLLLVGQSVAAVTSLGSFAWAMTAYHRALRCSLPDKANMNIKGSIAHFFWHFFIIGSRVLAMAMFASIFHFWVFIVIGVHYVVMLTWIMHQNSNFCDHKCWEVMFKFVVAVVYVFCYFNLLEGHTRLRYLFYYAFTYTENIAMVLTWYLFTQTHELWYHIPGVVFVIVGFLVGVLLQVVYYMQCHPNNYPPYHDERFIMCWVPCKELKGDDPGYTTTATHKRTSGSRRGSLASHEEQAPLNGRYDNPSRPRKVSGILKQTSRPANMGDDEVFMDPPPVQQNGPDVAAVSVGQEVFIESPVRPIGPSGDAQQSSETPV